MIVIRDYSYNNTAPPVWKRNKTTNQYDYPILDGTSGWCKFGTMSDKIKVCKIPDDILKRIQTRDLLYLILRYPLLVTIFSYDSFYRGLQMMESYFNGLKEFTERRDRGEVLFEEYCKLSVDCCKDNEEYFKICFIELLLAYVVLQKNMEQVRLKELYYEIDKKNLERKELQLYKRTQNLFYEVLYESQDRNEKKVGTSINSYYIYTPNGSRVKVQRLVDYSSMEKSLCNLKFQKAFPNCLLIDTCTYRYNCHSYAFYCSSTENNVWMNHPERYFIDGSYQFIGNSPTANDQRIFYDIPRNYHSGIVVDYAQEYIISKWGSGPLVVHHYLDCPYETTSRSQIKYFTRN